LLGTVNTLFSNVRHIYATYIYYPPSQNYMNHRGLLDIS